MILHIVPDSLYSDLGVRQFEKYYPGRSKCLVWGNPRTLTYVKQSPVFIDEHNALEILNDSEVKAIFVHKMTYPVMRLLPRIQKSKTVLWIPWGSDYYNTLLAPLFSGKLLLPLTRGVRDNRLVISPADKSFISQIKFKVCTYTGFYSWRYRRNLQRIDIMLGLIENELRMVFDVNPWFRPKVIPWGYPHPELNSQASSFNMLGDDIMIGNSCSVNNNHFDAFKFVSCNIEVQNRRVYCPLSYGNAKYGDIVETNGRSVFGERFIAMRKVLPREEYNSVLSSCGFVFFLHQRQEAVGNIVARLFAGARVFLAKRNPVLAWLRSKGVDVDCIEDLELKAVASGRKVQLEPLSDDSKKANREIVLNLWGVEMIDRYTRDLVAYLNGAKEAS